jgi:hypothetical protein
VTARRVTALRTLMVSISFSERFHDMIAGVQGLAGPGRRVVAKVMSSADVGRGSVIAPRYDLRR